MYKILWARNEMPKAEDKELAIMAPEESERARTFHKSFPQYSETPLAELDGMINLAMGELAKVDPHNPVAPLSVCVAMSQGYIGYDLQNCLREELLDRGIAKPVSSIITQVRVDAGDEAFNNPTKPIGRFMTKEEADEMVQERQYDIIEDAGRGYRRVVASPKPVEIIEIETVKSLMEAGQVVIAAGGGGIPVCAQGNHLKGAAAVVDKDFASELLAEGIDADYLIILTAVEHASFPVRYSSALRARIGVGADVVSAMRTVLIVQPSSSR